MDRAIPAPILHSITRAKLRRRDLMTILIALITSRNLEEKSAKVATFPPTGNLSYYLYLL